MIIDFLLSDKENMKPIFISGPHGCGKTAFINELLKNNEVFEKDEFYLDFVNDLATISSMSIFEKCLLRLYHRFYTAEQAILSCQKYTENKILIVDRSIYDSMVYNVVEYKLGTITEWQYNFLMDIAEKALEIIKPYTIILNPATGEVVTYLNGRSKKGERKKRDILCAREDTVEYISLMHEEYEKVSQNFKVLYATGNQAENVQNVNEWIKGILAN